MTGGNLFYPLLSTGLILSAVFVNYLRKRDTDHFQRRIYLSVLAFIFAAIAANAAGALLEGRPGGSIHLLLALIYNIYFIFQQLSYYAAVVFLDYLVNKDNTRTKRFFIIIAVLMAVNILILVFNHFSGFHFYISGANRFVAGSQFLVRFYMSYSAVLAAIIDIFISYKQLRSAQIRIIVYFALLCGAGAVLDILLPGGNLIWAFLITSMLIAYFYIIHSDSALDIITGVSSRSGLMEFVNRIKRSNARQSYTMALFDIDDLKTVNKNFGRAAGDGVLAEIAALLKKCTRQYDFIARIGGDEFVTAVKAEFDIERILERIQSSLGDLNRKPDRRFSLSVSYGYDTYAAKEEQSIDEFLRRLKERAYRYRYERGNDANNLPESTGA